ncbi:MAG: tetratricopeptide repeat protein, partial [Planctomycetota bacterium]
NCKVIPPVAGDETVRVIVGDTETPGEEENGSLVLRMETIEQIEYDYASQAASLAEDDYPAHYRLGLWCLERRLFPEGVARLLHARGHDGVPPEVEYYLGEAYTELLRPDLRQALLHLERYLDLAPDGEQADEAAELAAEVQKKMKELGLDPEEAPVEAGPGEGLETGDWAPPPSGWGNHAEVSRPRARGEGGTGFTNTVLRIDYKDRNRHGKRLPADEAKTPVQISIERDLSATPVLQLHAFNPDKRPIRFAIGITAGPNHEWFESRPVVVPPGKWVARQRLDLLEESWKCEASGWQHRVAVRHPERVRNLVVLVYNGNSEGSLILDAIRFLPSAE